MRRGVDRIAECFDRAQDGVLNIYVTAGYPHAEALPELLLELQNQGVDMVEVGFPFSDPLADGPVIQKSSQKALEEGMTVRKAVEQLASVRSQLRIPVIGMAYFNQIMQYGSLKFLEDAAKAGFDGLIIPDLPPSVYRKELEAEFDRLGLGISFLISPQSSAKRVKELDSLSRGFLYMVADYSVTGASLNVGEKQKAYYDRINQLGLENPKLIGFGVSTRSNFEDCCAHAQGAIIGSAFIQSLKADDLKGSVEAFVQEIRPHSFINQ